MFFDVSKCIHRARAIIILIDPYSDVIPISYHLSFDCTNNMADYEAIILGMKVVILLKVKKIKIFGDSQLIVKKLSNIYNIKDPKLQPYKEMVENILIYFNEYEIDNIPRDSNKYVDAMASVIFLAPINIDEKIILTIKNIGKPSHEHVVEKSLLYNYLHQYV